MSGSSLGAVSISITDRLTGRQTILPCYLSIAEWSSARSDGLSCLLKQPPGKQCRQADFMQEIVHHWKLYCYTSMYIPTHTRTQSNIVWYKFLLWI